MIVGFKRFEAAFLPHRESFILIGGTAVQMVLGQYDSPKGFANRARVTHDIDILVLPEFTQTHVHRVGDAIQPSPPLLSPSLPALNLSQHQGLFKCISFLH